MPNGKTHIEYGQIGNQIHSLVVRIDPFGTIIYLNDIAQTFFGYPRDALINQNIFGTIIEEQPKDRERLRSLVARVVHDPKVPVFAEIEARKADHERSWISFSITPHFEDGQLRDLVCVGNDVSDSKHLEIELRETNDRFKVMLENVQTGVIILDPDEKIILYANYEAAKIIGVDRDQIVGESCDHWCLEMVSACDTLKTNDTENIHHSETFIDRPGGTRIHVYLSATYIFFRGNGYILASFIDISEQKHTEDKLLNASRQIEELLSSIVSVLIGVSIDDYVTHWNKAAEEMFGIPEQDVVGKRFPLCPVEWDWRRIYEGIANSILTNKVIKLRGLKFKSREGKEGFLDTTINPILDKSKKVTGYIIFGEDATDRQMNKILIEEIERRKKAEEDLREANEELERLATHDSLTDLYNRRFLMQSLENECRRSLRYNTSLSLLIMDVDHFKNINDAFGHLIGDKVLVAIAETILHSTRSTDISGRYGGEEFCIMLPLTDAVRALITAEKLRIAINMIRLDEMPDLRVSCSIGITELSPGDTDSIALIRRADEALYEAKENGRNRSVMWIQKP